MSKLTSSLESLNENLRRKSVVKETLPGPSLPVLEEKPTKKKKKWFNKLFKKNEKIYKSKSLNNIDVK
jgi:hypothetical protein